MVSPLSRFASAFPHPLDLILHVGPGPLASPADYAPLHPAQLLLVDANPTAAARLESAFARSDLPTHIFETLLLPESRPASLFQFNLPALNGIRPIGQLQTLYPNLRLLEELPLQGESFTSFLAAIPLEATLPRLLILDVPGQELALLESISTEQLESFEWILLRGAASAWQEHSNPLSTAAAFLDVRHYETVAADSESDPAWPLQLLRLNQRHAALQRKLDSRARQLESQAADLERLSLRVAELELALSQHAAATSEAAETRAALQTELDSRARLLVEKATQIYEQSDRLTQLEPQIAQLQSQNDSLQTELRAARELADSQSQQLASSSEQLAQAQAQLRSLEITKTELESALTSQKTLVQALTKGRAQQDQLASALTAERNALRKSLETAQLRITDCEAQLAAKDASTSLLDTEFQKIEGQMDLIKDLVFRDHAR
jgi:hypothetical protein